MSQHPKRRLGFTRLGWFAAVTLVSALALAQQDKGKKRQPAAVPAAPARPAAPSEASKSVARRPLAPKPAALNAVAKPPAPAPAVAPVSDIHGQEPVPPDPSEPHYGQAGPSGAAHEPHHGHGQVPADATGHAESGHKPGHHESEDPPTFDDINWYYGLLGESDEGEESLLYRPKGMPVPFLATLINWGLLVGLIVVLARKQLPAALAKRKASIVHGMDEAKKARDESAAILHEYEEKLAKIDNDIERVKDEMRKAGELERDRILAEAVERRARMERDARRLIETELEAVKDSLRAEVAKAALLAAKQSIEGQVAASDQQRLFDEAIASLKRLPPHSLGGQA